MSAIDSDSSAAFAPPSGSTRVAVIDVARGAGIVAMIGYHACWDITFFGWARFDLFGDGGWLAARTAILSVFLGLVGVGLVLATRRDVHWRRMANRISVIAACALAITVATRWWMPDSYIFFGVLHHIVLASLLGLLFLRVPVVVAGGVALGCFALPELVSAPVFDSPWLLWVGLGTHPPRSNDYVALLPWFGVVLAGMVAGRALLAERCERLRRWQPRLVIGRGLAWAGRHSLPIYMVHQPVLFGALYLAVSLTGAGSPGGTFVPAAGTLPEKSEGFLSSCQVSCEKSGRTLGQCAGYCRCVAADLAGAGLWQAFRESRLDDAGKARVMTVVRGCAAGQGAR